MSVTKTFAGQTFQLPQNKEPKSSNWGLQVSNFLIRVADFAIPKTGGSNPLTAADLDFGSSYGLISKYIKSNTTPISTSTTTFLRLSYGDGFSWRNNANSANLSLTLASDRLQFEGSNLLLASDATTTNTASKIVQRDASGNFAAGTITASSFSGPLSGNASTATALQTQRAFTLTGDVTGGPILFNGTGNVTINTTIEPNSVALGTDTTGNYVATIAGTTNQVTVTGSGSETAAVTLALPQDIATSSSPTFSNLTLSGTSNLKVPVGTTAERPGTPANGQIRYNSDTSSYEGYSSGAWSAIGGGGTLDRVTQASHGFSVGNILYLAGSTYTKAIATATNTAEIVGMVSRVVDTNTFELTLSGEVTGLSSLTAGENYFLSDTTAGTMSTTEPTNVGYVSVPVGVASSTTSFYVAIKRGVVVGGANARTQITLSNSTTATVQDVSTYDAGELTGWISITATTPLKFFVKAPFAKNGAGTNWNISPSYMGDTPPAGFSLSITSGGVIQYTMPSVSGFTSAYLNYALNAPAVGTSFPLSVSSSSIQVVDAAPLSYRNKLINGSFSIWQRGTSQTNFGYGSDDRWSNLHSGSSKTASQQTFTLGQTAVPNNPTYYSRTVVTSVAGASNYVAKVQCIESVRTLSGQTATVSFWAKADLAKNIAIEFSQYFGTGGTPSATINSIGVTTCVLTTNWQKYTATVSIPSISGKTIGTNGDDYLQLLFWFDAGSSFNSRTNSLGQQSGTFDIAQVQLEVGSSATAFEQRPIGLELSLCQRYCFVPTLSGSSTRLSFSIATGVNTIAFAMPMPVTMRTTPTSSLSAVTAWVLSDGTNTASTGLSFANSPTVASPNFAGFQITLTSGLTQYRPYFFETTTGSPVAPQFSAEL